MTSLLPILLELGIATGGLSWIVGMLLGKTKLAQGVVAGIKAYTGTARLNAKNSELGSALGDSAGGPKDPGLAARTDEIIERLEWLEGQADDQDTGPEGDE